MFNNYIHESTMQTLDALAKWIPDDDINAGMKATEAFEFRPEIWIYLWIITTCPLQSLI